MIAIKYVRQYEPERQNAKYPLLQYQQYNQQSLATIKYDSTTATAAIQHAPAYPAFSRNNKNSNSTCFNRVHSHPFSVLTFPAD